MAKSNKLGKPDGDGKYTATVPFARKFWPSQRQPELPEGTNAFMRDLNPETPREYFMTKQGFLPTDAYRLMGQKDGTAILTYGLEELLDAAGKIKLNPKVALFEIGESKQHKDLVICDEEFSEEESRKMLLDEIYFYKVKDEKTRKIVEKEMPLVDKVGGLFAAYLKMPEAKIDATQDEFLQSFASLYKIKDEIWPDIYMEAHYYLLNRFIGSKLPKIEEFQKKYGVQGDFALEAKIAKRNIFGTNGIEIYHPMDFSLYVIEPDGNSIKYALAPEFQDLAYVLTIGKFDNLLLLDIEAQKENKKATNDTIDRLAKEVFG